MTNKEIIEAAVNDLGGCFLCKKPEFIYWGVFRTQDRETMMLYTTRPLIPGKERVLVYGICEECGPPSDKTADAVEEALLIHTRETLNPEIH